MKFNLKEALEAKGFTPIADPFGLATFGQIVRKTFTEGARSVTVTARFTPDYAALTVSYAYGDSSRPFKVKTHLSDRRAYRAIEYTLQHHSLAF